MSYGIKTMARKEMKWGVERTRYLLRSYGKEKPPQLVCRVVS